MVKVFHCYLNISQLGTTNPITSADDQCSDVRKRKRKMTNVEGPPSKKLVAAAEYDKISITDDSKIITRPLKNYIVV